MAEKITIRVAFDQTAQSLGVIGRVGENIARQILFDCSAVLSGRMNAAIICVVKRPRDTAPYAATLTQVGSTGISDTPDEPIADVLKRLDAALAKVETAYLRYPIIGENGNWLLWDVAQGEWVDSGESASSGGASLTVSEDGNATIGGGSITVDAEGNATI